MSLQCVERAAQKPVAGAAGAAIRDPGRSVGAGVCLQGVWRTSVIRSCINQSLNCFQPLSNFQHKPGQETTRRVGTVHLADIGSAGAKDLSR